MVVNDFAKQLVKADKSDKNVMMLKETIDMYVQVTQVLSNLKNKEPIASSL